MIPEISLKLLLTFAGVVGLGWGAHEHMTSTYASREDVKVAMLQSQFLLDLRIENIVKAIARLENTKNKTPTQLEELRELRHQLELMRRARRGK